MDWNLLSVTKRNYLCLRLYKLKLNNFSLRPYDNQTYEDEIDEDEVLDEEGRARLKLKVC